MTEATPLRLQLPPAPEALQGALTARVQALRAELDALRAEFDAEMYARARAEAEADWRGELVVELQRRLATLETANGRLLRIVGSRLLRLAWPAALAGGTAAFAAVALLRAAGL